MLDKIPEIPGLLIAEGAYGRTATLADWEAGKDFKIVGGPYFSNRDAASLRADGFDNIMFFGRSPFSVTL